MPLFPLPAFPIPHLGNDHPAPLGRRLAALQSTGRSGTLLRTKVRRQLVEEESAGGRSGLSRVPIARGGLGRLSPGDQSHRPACTQGAHVAFVGP